MNLIKSCPACGRNLRFPIDKGTIRVRCVCGESFVANPDDPALYKNATFDIAHVKEARPGLFDNLSFAELRTRARDLKDAVMQRTYRLKYTIQNFPLLPATSQRRIVLIGVAAGIALAAILYFIYILHARRIPPEGVIV
ncbi:MAG: hypothetical protein EPN93_12845 [Spirochaetes bacterium]|nr:MAG: hypothetical protein EPN93_12845 [Spirochaetota bacterium]